MAAQRLAIDAPERVRAVVAVTPVPATGAKMPPEVLAVFESAATDDAAAAMVVEISLGQRCTPALTRHVLRGRRATVDAPVFSAYLKAFTATDFSSEAAGLRCPLLVLYGEHDGGVSGEMVNAVFPSLYPAVQLRVLPNAGHYPMVETPPHLVTVVERFLMAPDALLA
jgi:pimeloyl-ACP methyl ester carboxylesterase